MKGSIVVGGRLALTALSILIFCFSVTTSAQAYSHNDSHIKWHEYSQEAFSRAEKEGKPVFMLITAVWCYWCHVYEEKTLEVESVADYINSNYVPVFLDFDERKDIARRYPASGLPTTVIFAPNGEELITVPGYITVEKLIDSLKKTAQFIKEEYRPRKKEPVKRVKRGIVMPEKQDLATYVEGFVDMAVSAYDSSYGGFGLRQKEPFADEFLRLLQVSLENNDKELMAMVTNTLDHMAGFSQEKPKSRKRPGFEALKKLRKKEKIEIYEVARLQDEDVIIGIYDPVEGGFFRYATRRDWTVPHYEKMLSDNAFLTLLFLKGYEATGDKRYRKVAEKSLGYVLRKLFDNKESRFLGSQDADEVYYHFTRKERKKVKSPIVDRNSYTPSSAKMVITLFNAAEILKKPEYGKTAVKALEFISRELITDYGVLSYYDHKDKKGFINGSIEANVWTALAFIEAYRFTKEEKYLKLGLNIIEFSINNLYDKEDGGFFERRSTSQGFYREGELFLDEKPLVENGVMAYTMYLAYRETGEVRYLKRAKETFGAFLGVELPVSAYFHSLAAALLSEKWL